ncbi:VWFA and cache domain-containing protein CG16868 [Scaptodrosophila lebanonensis]|uniref:VWFA and cache domain-containing protein CG16868 n=1 Tax=Drosophila lebanonensis TaxID=7225 RepID=A0A6J2TJ16_DROLE|nr:VWFA and cache domain-containing protein CG16868 [Scaptodrosophila lebanonensis]
MWQSGTIILTLLALALAVPATAMVEVTTNSSQHVPLFLSNTNKPSANTTTSNKVPTPNSNAAYMQQTPASVFFANYNNQQNVMQLVRNVDGKLRSIRNVEMHVAKIQEIFDSMHLTSGAAATSYRPSSASNGNNASHINDSIQSTVQLQHDLQLFSKRLIKKLEKATHIVLELRDLLRVNLTKVLVQQHVYDDLDEEEDSETELDFDMEDLNGSSSKTNTEHMHLYLNTHIENCQADFEAVSINSGMHYNKQQIQILNYLKSDDARATFLNENNARSLAANSYVTEQLTRLKQRLIQNDEQESKTMTGTHVKHLYFLSNSDGAPAGAQFRQLYVSAIKRKFVLLLIDVGSAINAELFELSKNFVNQLLQLLDDSDYIAMVTVSSEVDYMFLDNFPAEAAYGIYSATRAHKEEIMNYMNNLSLASGRVLTNHTLGFEYAFQLLHRLQNSRLVDSTQPIEFIYITRGLLTNLSDAMYVLRAVAQGQARLQAPVIINTCAVILDEKRIMYEKQFLSDVATQNYTKYDIDVRAWLTTGQQLAGRFFVLNKMHPETLLRASTRVFGQLFTERFLNDTLEVHAPVVDSESKDVLVAVTHAIAPYGVVGVNLYLDDLIEDLLNYQPATPNNKQPQNYAFLLDRSSGNTLAHPAFPRPLIQRQTSYPVDISYLENATDFVNIRQRMLREDNGNLTTSIYLGRQLLQRSYHWKSVLGIYVICLVSTTNMQQLQITGTGNLAYNASNNKAPITLPLTMQRFNIKDSAYESYYGELNSQSMDLLYHRLDLTKSGGSSPKTCRYFRQLATLDAPTLFLSSAAFESPFTFLHNNRPRTQLRNVEAIMAYLRDPSGLLANPGLRPRIRHEVNVLYQAMQLLWRRHQDGRGGLRSYIIRRYIASVHGVLQIYPGCLLSSNYDATRRPWFRQALAQPGKLVSTAPYLDAGGAGNIVTIAHTIFEGKAHALHSAEQDEPLAIVAIDVPYAFYYRIILDTTPLCQLPHIKCLLFEHEGYLLAHPSMLQPAMPRNLRRPHEHLTHKESYLANDMLNHATLVRKLGCASYQNRTLQRYYAFNTSLTAILSNVVHGERTKYAIALLRGSNLFAAFLNSSCDGGAFCPCSTIDRVCLNCNRMDQTDCECPCECPMLAPEAYANYTQQFPYCSPPGEHFVALPPTPETLNALPSCVAISCEAHATQEECLAVMGCEWCQQDVEGNSFGAAFCTAQAGCFNGMLASLTPYGELDELELLAAQGYNPQRDQHAYSAFGPLGGAIVVLALVIGFAIYCYRHNLDTQEQFYVDSMQEENYGLPLSRFNFDDCQAHDEPPLGYDHASAQRQLMHPADISPYHVSTGSSFRRPPNGESDNGYSTMTPHEDSSDQQCFTLAEPLLLHDKRHSHSKSDTMSISTSISSPTNRQQSSTQPNTHPYLSNQSASKTERYKQATPSPCRGMVYGQTTLALCADEEQRPHYILAPVTVHRHMETAES